MRALADGAYILQRDFSAGSALKLLESDRAFVHKSTEFFMNSDPTLYSDVQNQLLLQKDPDLYSLSEF